MWGMSTQPRRSGRCPQHRSCSRSPQNDSSHKRENGDDPLAPTLEAFFTCRLINEKGARPRTIAAYRATFRLPLSFAQHHTGKQPSALEIDDLDATMISAFLDHLEHQRGNSIRTRNARLAAIHDIRQPDSRRRASSVRRADRRNG